MNRTTLDIAFKISTGACTHIGLGRDANEDAMFETSPDRLSKENPRGRLWAVADGMGGHSGGRIASSLACHSLQTYYDRALAENTPPSTKGLCRHLTDTVFWIDRLVRLKAASLSALAHMGTTLSCLLLADGHSIIAHVGDSRIYRLRDGHLNCLTTDHTFVQEMIFEGEVDPAYAHLHPMRNLLTHAVGTGEPLCHVDRRIDRLNGGDRFLLCTDGLHNVLHANDIAAMLASDETAACMAKALVAEALTHKTRDNVTALVIQLAKDGPEK